ncbi:MAG: hypothetical protein WCD18_06890 [Thermosynechococcaceae cyanobacterium]
MVARSIATYRGALRSPVLCPPIAPPRITASAIALANVGSRIEATLSQKSFEPLGEKVLARMGLPNDPVLQSWAVLGAVSLRRPCKISIAVAPRTCPLAKHLFQLSERWLRKGDRIIAWVSVY